VIPLFPVYLFDVDGTLLDSAVDIVGAIQEALAAAERPAVVDFDFLKNSIGHHLAVPFGDIFPDYSSQQIDEIIRQYRVIYLARGHKMTRVYPGVPEALAALPGRKSTATTKGTPTTRLVLEQFGLIQYFDHVQGTDGFPALRLGFHRPHHARNERAGFGPRGARQGDPVAVCVHLRPDGRY